ncbi:hypothetical protein [Citricoccus sp. GCM10030269]|uniref:hypothetical protein n=1 Tax=Citricoccus sp. GCM10030269 TaxID=3273388 RepID=UPI0036078E66
MKHPLLVTTAALAALLVGVGGLGGVWTTAVVSAVLVVVAALGWPQLLGAPARKSLTAVLGVTGLVAVAAAALWPGRNPGEEAAAFGASFVEPIAVCMALGIVAAFMVQLFRGAGSPHRLESTAGTIAGLAVVCAGAGWTALVRLAAETSSVSTLMISVASVALSLIVAALAGLVPLPRHGDVLLAVVLAGVVPVAVSVITPLPLPAAVVAGVLAAVVLILIGRTAPQRGAGRPDGVRAALALGVAPVAVAGLLTYFVFRIMPV